MSVAAAVMSTASSAMYVLHSTRHFTPGTVACTWQIAGTAFQPDLAPQPQHPVPIFRPLVAICRLPRPAASAAPRFLSSARTTSSLVALTTPAASYASAATYGDEESYDDDDEWQSGDGSVATGGSGASEPTAKNEKEGSKKKGGNEAGRLYVGNLPYSMTQDQLAEVFREAGPVRSVEVVYDRVTDRSRGFAFVTMAGEEEAREAIRLFDRAQVGGRTARVNFPEVPRGGEREVMGPRMRGSGGAGSGRFVESPHKVYAGNLGWSVTSESLGRALEGLPGFLSARVVFDRDTGRSRGYGFVSFASQEDAQSAIDSMNGVELEGRPLRLSPTTGKAPPAATKISVPSSPE